MTPINFYTVHAEEIEADIFVVEARGRDGRWFQHQGPKDANFFTRQQAERLVARVIAAGEIDEQYWVSGGTGYGTVDHEMALIEAER